MSSLPLSVSCGFYNIKRERMVLRSIKHVPSDLCSLLSLYLPPFFSSFLCNFIFLPSDTSFFSVRSSLLDLKKEATERSAPREEPQSHLVYPSSKILSGKAGTGRETCWSYFQVKPSEQVFRMQIAISLHMMNNKLDSILFFISIPFSTFWIPF